jgi:hypothetical protein
MLGILFVSNSVDRFEKYIDSHPEDPLGHFFTEPHPSFDLSDEGKPFPPKPPGWTKWYPTDECNRQPDIAADGEAAAAEAARAPLFDFPPLTPAKIVSAESRVARKRARRARQRKARQLRKLTSAASRVSLEANTASASAQVAKARVITLRSERVLKKMKPEPNRVPPGMKTRLRTRLSPSKMRRLDKRRRLRETTPTPVPPT